MKTIPAYKPFYQVILSTLAVTVMGMLIFSGVSPAQDGTPQSSAGGKPGDCMACHTGQQVLSEDHADTTDMTMQQCLICHGPGKIPLSEGFLAAHEQMLSGGPKESPSAEPAKSRAEEPVSVQPSSSLPADCTSCHSETQYTGHFKETAHGALSCTVCHTGVGDLSLHMQGKEKPSPVSCATCHKDVEEKNKESRHAEAGISCLQCHRGIHPQEAAGEAQGKARSTTVCLQCHSDREKYVDRGHTARVMAGNTDAATCTDCHGVHGTKAFEKTEEGDAKKRAYYTALCTFCHAESGVAGNYGVFPKAAEAFGQTYHGKAMKLGEPDRVAGCADCHLAHNILPADNPASALNQAVLVETCGECHKNFHPRFVSYVPHPDPHDKAGFYSLYLTEKFMIALLVGVFAFFWVHCLLWWRKVYAEKRRLKKAGLVQESDLPEELASRYVRRFGVRERIMHIVLILSFFGVVVSGFPIKYAGAPWAKAFISLMGGVAGAALIHRVSAAAMSLLFLYVCWRSLRFLFPGFKVKGWLGRLFGPESLFPRWKDFQDCFGMFKWFFNAGEKPEFDRWTYWEKFDFMAVFWGMFVIGLSGMVLWIPEYASWVMPGWMINIMHLAHSEEAFLAAVFIFTVHFFNTHLVPDKFPLEKNIFTGRYTVGALKHERPLEYERIVREGRLEEISCEGPGSGVRVFAWMFGIASILLGIVLTVLIFWAMLG